jgi:hypothetical protein
MEQDGLDGVVAVFGYRLSISNHPGDTTMTTSELSLPFYEDVLEFLASGPSSQQVVEYRPSAAAQNRFSALLEANRKRTLSLEEEEELDHYVQMDRMLSLLKAKSYKRLAAKAA